MIPDSDERSPSAMYLKGQGGGGGGGREARPERSQWQSHVVVGRAYVLCDLVHTLAGARLFANGEPQIGTVERSGELVAVRVELEVVDDVESDLGVGRGRERGDGHVGEVAPQVAQLAVRRPEVVPPLADAVRLVDDEPREEPALVEARQAPPHAVGPAHLFGGDVPGEGEGEGKGKGGVSRRMWLGSGRRSATTHRSLMLPWPWPWPDILQRSFMMGATWVS